MGRFKLAFGISPGSIMYFQSNASWYGEKMNSVLLSCKTSKEDAINRAKKVVRFLEKRKNEKPVNWKDVMERRMLFDESYDHEQAGDLLRDDCHVVRSVDLTGGILFGGFDGMKYSRDPTMNVDEADEKMWKWNLPVVVTNCKFDGKHECVVESHKDTMEHLKMTQDIIKKMFLRQEVKKWRDHPSNKGRTLADRAGDLLERDRA